MPFREGFIISVGRDNHSSTVPAVSCCGWRWLTNYRAPSIGSPLSQGVVTWCSNLLKTLQELHGAPPNWRSLSKKFQRVFSRVQQTKRARVVVWLASSNSTLSSWIKWKKEERKKDQIPPYIYTQGRARSDVNIFVCSIRSFKIKFKKKGFSLARVCQFSHGPLNLASLFFLVEDQVDNK
jgi:hypothetical protein